MDPAGIIAATNAYPPFAFLILREIDPALPFRYRHLEDRARRYLGASIFSGPRFSTQPEGYPGYPGTRAPGCPSSRARVPGNPGAGYPVCRVPGYSGCQAPRSGSPVGEPGNSPTRVFRYRVTRLMGTRQSDNRGIWVQSNPGTRIPTYRVPEPMVMGTQLPCPAYPVTRVPGLLGTLIPVNLGSGTRKPENRVTPWPSTQIPRLPDTRDGVTGYPSSGSGTR